VLSFFFVNYKTFFFQFIWNLDFDLLYSGFRHATDANLHHLHTVDHVCSYMIVLQHSYDLLNDLAKYFHCLYFVLHMSVCSQLFCIPRASAKYKVNKTGLKQYQN